MSILARMIVTSEGYNGAPGYNILHTSQGTLAYPLDKQEWANGFGVGLSNGFQDVQAYLVDEVTFSIGPTVQFIESDTGELVDEVTANFSNPVITGTGSGMALDRSACVNVALRTNDFINGRRLIGRSFIGPISNNGFTSAGQIDSGVVATFSGMFDGLTSGLGARLCVWHRPTSPTAADGAYGDVVTVVARSVPGTLRSRKT